MFGKKFLDCCFLVMSHGSGIEKGLGNHIEDEISAKSRFGTIIKEDLNRNVFAVENYCGVPYLRKKQQEHIIRQLAGHISRFGEKPYTHDVHQKVGFNCRQLGTVCVFSAYICVVYVSRCGTYSKS